MTFIKKITILSILTSITVAAYGMEAENLEDKLFTLETSLRSLEKRITSLETEKTGEMSSSTEPEGLKCSIVDGKKHCKRISKQELSRLRSTPDDPATTLAKCKGGKCRRVHSHGARWHARGGSRGSRHHRGGRGGCKRR